MTRNYDDLISVEPARVMVDVQTKPFWASKEIWTVALTVILQVLTYIIDPENSMGLDPQVVKWIRTAIFALGMVMTVVFRVTTTSQPISLNSNKKRAVPAAVPGSTREP